MPERDEGQPSAMDGDYPRSTEELAAMVDDTIRPLAATGDPIARQMLRCLTCDNVEARCSDCWNRAKSEREAALDPSGASDLSPNRGRFTEFQEPGRLQPGWSDPLERDKETGDSSQ